MKTNTPDLSLAGPAAPRLLSCGWTSRFTYLLLALLIPGMPDLSRAEEPGPRVVGGYPVNIASYAYQVALIARPYSTANIRPNQFCGGSIVDREWIITAAHCSVGKLPSQVAVAVGVMDLTQPQSGRIFHVDQIVIHPNYNGSTHENDIALWHLSTPIEFGGSYSVQPIPLATPADAAAGLTADGRTAVVSGWGNTSGSGASYPNQLQAALLPITSQSDYPVGSITSDKIMAGFVAGGVDTCQGDSGGPLAVYTGTGGRVLAGVTSYGFGCARRGFPGVYARISHLYGWIMSRLPMRTVYVDWSFPLSGSPDGSLARPFPTFGQGYAKVAGMGTLKIRDGKYLVRYPLDKPMLLEPHGGDVQLGGTLATISPSGGRAVTEVPPPTLGVTGLRADGTLALSFAAVAGERYQVFASTDLKNWELWKDLVADSESVEVVDADVAVTPHRFFKLVAP